MSSFHSRTSNGSKGTATSKEMRSRLKVLTDSACADCHTRQPGWASLIRTPPSAPNNVSTITAFICYQCSGHHRSLGTHICRVKSLTLDDWSDRELWSVEIGGNQRVNAIFEARMNSAARKGKPSQHSSNQQRANFIREKYVERRYLDVSKYSLCREKRQPDVSRKGSFSNHSNSNNNTPVAPKIVKPSLFFTPPVAPTQHNPINTDDDMFADSATTTSDLFGKGSPTKKKQKRLTKKASIVQEEEEEEEEDYGDYDKEVEEIAGFDDPFEEEENEEESEIAYPKMAMSVSEISAFQTSQIAFNKSNVFGSANSTCGSGTTHTMYAPPAPKRQSSLPPLHSMSVEALEKQKQRAIKQEDFLKAAEIKKQIAAMLNPPAQSEISSLESLKKLAVRQEDYIQAAELKAKIEELREKGRSNRQLLVESSVNSVISMGSKLSVSPASHRRSLDTFFERNENEDDPIERAVEQGMKQAVGAQDLEEESIQLSQLGRLDNSHSFHRRPQDASERFSRSIQESSQGSKLDKNGFVVDELDTKETEKAPEQPKTPESSSSSRRTRRSESRDSNIGSPKLRSRSLTRKERLRRGSSNDDDKVSSQRRRSKSRGQKTASNDNDKESSQRRRSKSRDRKTEQEKKQRERSKSRDRQSEQDKKRRDRSKSRDRKSARDKERSRNDEEGNEKSRRARSRSRDRKSAQKEKARRDRSKSRDRKSAQRDKSQRERSKSRERNNAEKIGRAGREYRPSTGNKSSRSRSRSKSHSRRELRRELRRKNSTPAFGESSRNLDTTPSPSFQKIKQTQRPDFARLTSVYLRLKRVLDDGNIDKPRHGAERGLCDDISIDGSFKTFASDNVQSAHQRTSTERVSKSRRNLAVPEDSAHDENPPNRKGSRSLHAGSSYFDFEGARKTNDFFVSSSPASTPPAVSGRKTAKSADLQTPAPMRSRRQLRINSPAGVDEFPDVASPSITKSPYSRDVLPESSTSLDVNDKYKREVERTAARLRRLRMNRRR